MHVRKPIRPYCCGIGGTASDFYSLRSDFRPCATRFILQKFKRQMGMLTAFFETLKKDVKGRLSRILVIADSSAASEALVRMLEAYYTKDESQEKFLESRIPYITILDITRLEGRHGFRPSWMSYVQLSVDEHTANRIGLLSEDGRIYQKTLDPLVRQPLEQVLANFKEDSRVEASSILYSKIISSYASDGSYEIVLYPETATKIASNVLSLTSQGRGYSLPWQCGSLVKMQNSISTYLLDLT